MSSPESIPVLAGALAAAVAQGRSDEELALLAALLSQLGDSLALILAARMQGQTDTQA